LIDDNLKQEKIMPNWHEDYEDEPSLEEKIMPKPNWHEDFEDEPSPEEKIPEVEGESDPGEIRKRKVGEYNIVGNKNYAFACHLIGPPDHYFTRDPEVNDDAFVRACGWAYEPDDVVDYM